MRPTEKQQLFKKCKVNAAEKKKYIFDELRDFQILDICKRLENLNLSASDRLWVRVAKTQLEDDWRKPLLTALNKLLAKYKH